MRQKKCRRRHRESRRRKRNHQGKNLGRETEDAVEDAVKELIRENNTFTHYCRSKPSDLLDQDGVDILVYLQGGFALPIQIKSTYSKIHKFKQMHPHVRFVIIIRDVSLDKVSERYQRTKVYIKRKVKSFAERALRDFNNSKI